MIVYIFKNCSHAFHYDLFLYTKREHFNHKKEKDKKINKCSST